MKRSPRRTASQWRELVTEYTASSESERDFCKRQGIKLVTMRKWRYHFAPSKQKRTTEPQTSFVKVNVSPSGAPQEGAVLCIGQDVRLECPASVDIPSLAQLVLTVHHGR